MVHHHEGELKFSCVLTKYENVCNIYMHILIVLVDMGGITLDSMWRWEAYYVRVLKTTTPKGYRHVYFRLSKFVRVAHYYIKSLNVRVWWHKWCQSMFARATFTGHTWTHFFARFFIRYILWLYSASENARFHIYWEVMLLLNKCVICRRILDSQCMYRVCSCLSVAHVRPNATWWQSKSIKYIFALIIL
jgi:hypothetical protein